MSGPPARARPKAKARPSAKSSKPKPPSATAPGATAGATAGATTTTTDTTAETTTETTATTSKPKPKPKAKPRPKHPAKVSQSSQSQSYLDDSDSSSSSSDALAPRPPPAPPRAVPVPKGVLVPSAAGKRRTDLPQHPMLPTNAGRPRKKSQKQESIERTRQSQQARDQRQLAAQSLTQMTCPSCDGRDIEYDEKSGSTVCLLCGVVVEENAIVSSIEFAEAGGSSQVIGQFVAASMSKPYSSGSQGRRGGRYGFSRDSRETTLTNGRRRIQDVASRLRLGNHFVDSAHRFFQIAVEKNFVQGRKTTHVVAACLYIACRQQKSQHMLIDFSDALQVNVYTLGTCFLKFRRLLGLKLEIIDPALYVYRFASHLSLGEKSNAVSLTALRVVARMKRDWIVAGRRPAGVCAASLLIAARAHGFARSPADVTKILRVCGVTVTSRVREFELLPAAKQTFQQFSTIELESEADPPSFTRARLSEKKTAALIEGGPANTALIESGEFDYKLLSKERTTGKTKERKETADAMYSELEKELEADLAKAEKETKAAADDDDDDDDDEDEPPSAPAPAAPAAPAAPVPASRAIVPATEDVATATGNATGGKDFLVKTHKHQSVSELNLLKAKGVPVWNPLKENAANPASAGGAYGTNEETFNIADWMAELPEGNDLEDELASMLRTDDEVEEKKKIFNDINGAFLKDKKEKEQKRKDEEAAAEKAAAEVEKQEEKAASYRAKVLAEGGELPPDDVKQSVPAPKKKGKKAAAAAAAAQGMTVDPNNIQGNLVQSLTGGVRKVSRKIDYDAMSKKATTSSSSSSSTTTTTTTTTTTAATSSSSAAPKLAPVPENVVEIDDDDSSDDDDGGYKFL
ncbi:hypothetical protein TeGR_g8539 [Tetraparma gracilis]|uniref:TFIIB-type domain-containing protein n=1 Tax=Tetraparma gracilis TaxID=2962635 RepID=A0ABQ6ML11_9STRA|nr:hypothetical protein TeGR_g8539 [Tetraparma gracilis]